MPEYLAPGVFIEEMNGGPQAIEGVSTCTAGVVGPARFGPVGGTPELITSFSEFERVFGGLERLEFGGERFDNYLAHAVRAFFDQGGRRVYVSRVYTPPGGAPGGDGLSRADLPTGPAPVPQPLNPPEPPGLIARFPGRAGNMRITFTIRLSKNVLIGSGAAAVIRGVQQHDTVLVEQGGVYEAWDITRQPDGALQLHKGTTDQPLSTLNAGVSIFRATVDVLVERPIERPSQPRVAYTTSEFFEGLSLSPEHPKSLLRSFAENPPTTPLATTLPFAIVGREDDAGYDWLATLSNGWAPSGPLDDRVQTVYTLDGGSDGEIPDASAYEGEAGIDPAAAKTGLRSIEDIDDVSIIAAPGYSATVMGNEARAETIQGLLISHAERMRYRIAVLDSRDGAGIADVRRARAKIDSTHAAFYYPWITVLDPVTDEEINLPPSGFVAGIYARNDVENGVHKAPANEVVRGVLGFETMLNTAQQEVLNPEGINCFRFFSGRGFRLWGARTATSDPEWKYVSLRRYFAYLERSIDKGTQWVVFMNNGEPLWAHVRRMIESFLYNEWRSQRLLGPDPKQAYFVRCDRTTMTQNDIGYGRLICEVGVAAVRPAEFVIFRIGQWTAERRL